MLKVLFSVLCCLLMSVSTAFADTNEWVDKSYDFSGPKKVLVDLNFDQIVSDGINENVIPDLFWTRLEKNFMKDPISNIVTFDAMEDHKDAQGYDLIIKANVLKYEMGTLYKEGYMRSVPTTETTKVSTSKGQKATVTTKGTKEEWVPGGYFPAAFTCVKFEIQDTATQKLIWTRVDDRAKMNETSLDNTKPKDLYERILNSYFGNLKGKLKKANKAAK